MPVLHPAFIHFPIALVTLSFVCDLIGHWRANTALRAAGWWMLLSGGVIGIVTALTGLWDMYHVPIDENAHTYVDFHMWVGFAVLACVAILMFWRGYVYRRRDVPSFPYFIAAFLAVVLVLFQGWVGGEIVYSYGVGVAPTGQSPESVSTAQNKLKMVEEYLGPFEVSHEHDRGQVHEDQNESPGEQPVPPSKIDDDVR